MVAAIVDLAFITFDIRIRPEKTDSGSGKKKRKAKNDKFHFKKAARIQDEPRVSKEVDYTEENLKVIQKLSAISNVKSKAIEKIIEHEDRLKNIAKKEEGSTERAKPIFSDRDFDKFEKDYMN